MRILAPLLLTITALNAAQAAEAPVKTPAVANFKTCDKPEWPKDALRKQQTGTVVLGFLVGEDGKVIDAVVLTSSGVESLDQAALTGVRRCQFRPPQLNGVSFSSWTRMQYVWTLDTPEIAKRTQAEAEAYRAAALAGDTGALYKLAKIFHTGVGVEHNLEHYGKLLRTAAEHGQADAEAELAGNYLNGQAGVAKDPAQAQTWYKRAAQHGNAYAQLRMANGLASAKATPADLALAADWYRKAAGQGNGEAAYKLGQLYQNGRGVAQDYAEAAVWYRKGAEAGYAAASYGLGNLYLQGQGVARDPAQAATWLGQAADKRQPSAEAALANLYFTGNGVPQNDAEGVKYLRRAAIASHPGAMRQLGQMLSQGTHMPADPAEAAIWQDKVARLAGVLTEDQAAHFADW